MRGPPQQTKARPTVLDRPDPRLPELTPRRLTPEEMRHSFFRDDVIDPMLRPVDLCFQRWASNPGSSIVEPGLAQMRFLAGKTGGLPPLADRDIYMVDVALKRANKLRRSITLLWYRSERSTREIASSLGLPRHQAVHEMRMAALNYFNGCFDTMGMRLPAALG